MIPPLVARILVRDDSSINLWIPLFLLWILLAPIAILLLPFVLIFFVCTKGLRGLSAIWLFYQCLCALRGLDVNVQSPGSTVRVFFQ